MTVAPTESPITVIFVDPSSSRLGTDPGSWTEDELRLTDEEVERCIVTHGGHSHLRDGNGHIATFESSRRAVRCAVAVQRRLERQSRQRGREPESRIGINTGEVLDEAQPLADPREIAKRIAHRARGGEILAASVVKELAGAVPGVTFRDRGRVSLPDLPERSHLYEVVWRDKDAPPPPVLLPLERTPFVGREPERVQLLGLLDEAARGRGSLVLISGEPGVGKTRLGAEVVEEARRRGLLALIGQCYEMEDWVAPYGPVLQILEATRQRLSARAFRLVLGEEAGPVSKIMPELRHLYPDIPEPVELVPEQDRRHLFNSVCAVLQRAAEMQPLLLMADDLQWADESSLLLLEHMAEILHDIPALILGIHRDDRLDLSRPLPKTLRELLRRRLAHRIALSSLPRNEVEAMIETLAGQSPMAGVVDTIFSVTEGNPFFVEEVVKHVVEAGKLIDAQGRWRSDVGVDDLEVPAGARMVIETRLQRLSEQARRVLEIASLIGRDFTAELLAEISGMASAKLADVMDDAVDATLVVPVVASRQARFTFAHALFRQTLVAGLPQLRRQQLHAAIAGAMERVYAHSLDDHAVDLAHHLDLAGPAAEPQKVRHYLTLAGDQAFAVAAFEEALRHYQGALSLPDIKDFEECRLSLKYKEGFALARLGDLDPAIACWREALDGYEQLGAADEVGSLYREMALHLAWSGRWQEGLQMARRGLAALGERVSVDRGRLQCMVGRLFSAGGDPQAAIGMISQGLALAHELHDRRLRADALVAKTQHHYFYMEFHDAVEAGREAAELLRELRAQWELADVLAFVASSLGQLGRSGEAARVLEECEPLAVRFGNVWASALAGRLKALSRFGHTAGLADLEQAAVDELEACRRAALMLPYAHGQLGTAMFWQGRWDEALVQFQEGRRLPSLPALAGLTWAHLFLHHAYRGERDAALTMLEESRHELPRQGQANTWGSWTIALAAAEGLAVLGERDQAAAMYPLVLDVIATGAVFRYDRRLVQTVAGIVAGADRRWDEAEDHFRKALLQAEQLPHRIEQPEIRRFHAAMLMERDAPGDQRRAGELLRHALKDYQAIGAAGHEQIVKAALGRLRSQAPASRRRGADVPARSDTEGNLFRKEGEYWSIGYEGHTIRLKDSAGLRYLAQLLRYPGREFLAMDLAFSVQGLVVRPEVALDPGDLGPASLLDHLDEPMIDRQARASYERRLNDLAREIEDAQTWGHAERAAQLRQDRETLAEALARDVRLGGQSRKWSTPAERARVSVTKAIKAAERRIEESHPALARHLAGTVKTGRLCSYDPGRGSPVRWSF